jgi:ribosomal protein S18 acetylase RimI-like enzyme
VLALCRAADTAVWGDSDWTEADLREEWDELDLERDAWLVELDGCIAGYGTFADRREGRLMGDGYVLPELQGQGVGSRLVELYEQRAADIPAGKTLESAALRGDGAADRLFTSRGYGPVRHFYRMVIDHEIEPLAPAWPNGITVEPLDIERDGKRFYDAIVESFSEEWGWDWGWIYFLAVRPGWRRRGLGEALLRESFREFFRRGEHTIALGVDSQNPTGATRLYERVGMRVLWEAVVYRKELR